MRPAAEWTVELTRLVERIPTVIRTRGLTYVRPEKSWRPVVKVTVVDGGHDYALPDVALGSDGQNPNLKSVIPMYVSSQSILHPLLCISTAGNSA